MIVAVMAIALLVAGCGRDGGGRGADEGSGPAASGNFGNLTGVCRPGSAKTASAQGVTATEIEVGVFSDIGFTKNPDLVDAAKVFTSWCNAAGGINGRKLVTNLRDTKLMEVRQRMLESCREDFALVGGSAALDGLGVKDRLSCLLPEFPAQVTQTANTGSDLQLGGGSSASESVNPYTGFQDWLIKEAYPDSAGAIGMINGDSPITKVMGEKMTESLTAAGAKIVYNDLYPLAGVSDWTPYAQAIKAAGVKGLIFFGEYRYLAKLQDVLTSMNYELDWIDANANSYNQSFLDVTKNSLAAQNNYADLSGTAPLDAAAQVPAVQQLKDLFEQYAPSSPITFQVLRAFQSWLLFAKSATGCGDDLTRACVYNAAHQETAWTGGGLQAPVDLSRPLSEQTRCFNVQQATPDGWKTADFKPNNGVFRCGFTPYEYTRDFGKPLTLADVGKSMSDLK
ncbi:ABC transporter substrate-binding protein [Nocardia sp. CDC186]|uniref:ABC transporter substrate-binding protein n=1 Tax=Nocardia implantans TaxID=3108168 RepID=A0ABU6ARV9_9NOCA|nr:MULTISPECIES: ABC transporter substrate-binding protein [unclassified Nocardia]MBF6191654.1 ABC transporter substrate-binding protein [Nocardia beijingensis]MEA3528039.1 ABC transporter substrate-binding protein [Nocardia sp. CDC192]MEB3510209.1 ABC transporter substrate-binding protein [Nocardia sp. CDC186]